MGLLLPEYQTLLIFLRGIWLCKWRDSVANLPGNDASRKQPEKSCNILLLFHDDCSAQHWFSNKHRDSRRLVLRCCWHDARLFWPTKMTVQRLRRAIAARGREHGESAPLPGTETRRRHFRRLTSS
jgi:hypothetical protein